MAQAQHIPLPQGAIRLLQKQDPTRIVVLVRTRSRFYPLEPDAIVHQACTTLGVDPIQSRARLLTVMKEQRLNVLGVDLWHDGYDWATAHHPEDLPILVVDYGKRLSCVKVAGSKFTNDANWQVAHQHEVHGWDAKPPYFEDRTTPMRCYYSPRLVKIRLPDGTVARKVKTPPPGSVSAYPPYDVERPKSPAEKGSDEKGAGGEGPDEEPSEEKSVGKEGPDEKGSTANGDRGSGACGETTAAREFPV